MSEEERAFKLTELGKATLHAGRAEAAPSPESYEFNVMLSQMYSLMWIGNRMRDIQTLLENQFQITAEEIRDDEIHNC